MEQRWTLSFNDGATWPSTVVPMNGSKLAIVQERDLENGQIFFRSKINSAIRFGRDDYQQFLDIERQGASRCNTILVRVELKCANAWQELWRGKFSTGSGKFELDRCVFEVKPDTVDRYTCILEAQSVKQNILNVPPVSAEAINIPSSIEFATCNLISLGGCDSIYNSGAGWDLALEYFDSTLGRNVRLYWRERIITDCVADSPVPPPGSGWILLYDNCDGSWPYGECSFYPQDGQSVWVRPPSISYSFGTPVREPDASCVFPVFAGANYNGNPNANVCTGNSVGPIYVCLGNGDTTTFDRNRTLYDSIGYLLEKTGCGLTGIRSDFLEWNPPGDAPGYVAGYNYVTGEINQMDHLLIAQKSDIIDPTASNPATSGYTTFKDMMKALNVMAQLYWDIDDDGYLRIEHWRYWTFPVGITASAYPPVIEPQTYQHLAEQIPRIERAEWMEAIGPDFIGADIYYDSPCVNSQGRDDVQEYSPGKITTDIGYIMNDPTAISKDGFVILATTFDGSDYSVIVAVGALSLTYVSNAPLSWANLQRDFWTWNRYLPEGNMNRQDVQFDGWRPNIEQEGVSLPLCCDILTFDAKDQVVTRLGQVIGGINATVETAEYSLHDYKVRMKLRYSY